MTNSTISFLCIVLATTLWGILSFGKIPRPFHTRPCQGKLWKLAFPEASNDEIRQFLALFTDAFAFPEKEKLKFSPDDTILQIYRALYPRKWMADALEVETLAEDYESRYRVKFESIWYEGLSLGELFDQSRMSDQS